MVSRSLKYDSGMESLNPENENLITNFKDELDTIVTPCDMFPELCPPDSSGVREPRRPILPVLSGAVALELAPVYDLDASRRRRDHLVTEAASFLGRTVELVLV